MKQIIVCLILALSVMTGTSAANKAKDNKSVTVSFYGSELKVSLDTSKRVKVKKATEAEIDKCLKWIASIENETLQDCQRIRQEMNLCDWAYLKLLDKVAQAGLGNTNEAVLLTFSLLTKSGYSATFAKIAPKELRLLYYSKDFIFNKHYYFTDGKPYYLYGENESKGKVSTFQLSDKTIEGNPISLTILGEQKFAENLTEPRTITSKKDSDFSFTYQLNKNLIDFYGDYPASAIEDDFMIRWIKIAEQPMEPRLQSTLLKEMKQKLEGLSQQMAVQELLWWVQTGFEYKSDEDIWGNDRAFYAEETLFYPYSDSEDRTILLAQLVRNLLGLKVVLIYYPGHLAMGVCFTDDEVQGAYVVKDGWHFVVCDPSYIGSDIGEEIPTMVGQKRTVRILK